MPVVDTYKAILATDADPGHRWNATLPTGTPIIVTYRFPAGADLPPLELTYYDGTRVSAFDARERRAFRQATEEYERVAGIRFVEVDGPAMVDAYNIAGIGSRYESFAGYANYPYVNDRVTSHGDLVMNVPDPAEWTPGRSGFTVLLHELGHAVGLKHTHEGRTKLSGEIDDHDHTVMTYEWGTDDNPQTLQTLDRQALRHLYGRPQDTEDWTFRYKPGPGILEIEGGRGNDTIVVPAGDIRASGAGGRDRLHGREDGDHLYGGGGHDVLRGNAGADVLSGQRGADRLFGDTGRDTLLGGPGNDKLVGGRGADDLRGGGGQDRLTGSNGQDLLRGGGGTDRLKGGCADDELRGGAGADWLDGGAGDDILRGQGGQDRFVFRDGHDRIADWRDGETIVIDRAALDATGLRRADLRDMAEIDGDEIVFAFNSADSLTLDLGRHGGIALGHVLDDVVLI